MSETLYVSDAVVEIQRICQDRANGQRPKPFVLIVGAGVSYPPVPLAQMIEAECIRRVTSDDRGAEWPENLKPGIETYSYWLNRAFPHRELRQQYFAGLIRDQPLSTACLRLGRLLASKENNISSIIVTPNFDDFVVRSMMLYGQNYPVVCDHQRTVHRIDPGDQDVQIVHVHGSYRYYDSVNLIQEVRDRSRLSDGASQSMASLLDALFYQRSAIVVGYSGWDKDVIMRALRRRLADPLPCNLYWFLYDNTRPSAPWLNQNEAVRFVKAYEPPLLAEQVFDLLANSVNLRRHLLHEDPIRFFHELLLAAIPKEGPTLDRMRFAREATDFVEWASSTRDLCPQSFANAVQERLHSVSNPVVYSILDRLWRAEYNRTETDGETRGDEPYWTGDFK